MSEQSAGGTEQQNSLWDNREEYFEWLDENINEYECARCGATCSGNPVDTRFGPVDEGCYLLWSKAGKIQQRTLDDFSQRIAADGGLSSTETDREDGGPE